MIQGTVAAVLGVNLPVMKTVQIHRVVVVLAILARMNREMMMENGVRLQATPTNRVVMHEEAEEAMATLRDDTDTLRNLTQQKVNNLTNHQRHLQ